MPELKIFSHNLTSGLQFLKTALAVAQHIVSKIISGNGQYGHKPASEILRHYQYDRMEGCGKFRMHQYYRMGGCGKFRNGQYGRMDGCGKFRNCQYEHMEACGKFRNDIVYHITLSFFFLIPILTHKQHKK